MRIRPLWVASVPVLLAAVAWFAHEVTTTPSPAIEWPYGYGAALALVAVPTVVAVVRAFAGRPTLAYAVAVVALFGAQLWDHGGRAASLTTAVLAHAATLAALTSSALAGRATG